MRFVHTIQGKQSGKNRQKLSMWHLDFVVGLPPSEGKDSFLTCVDPYSGFRCILPSTRDATGQDVVKLLESHIISKFGPPDAFFCDNASNILANKDAKKLCRFYDIAIKHMTPYSSKLAGRVEVTNRFSTQLLSMLSHQFHLPWTKVANLATLLLNSKPIKHYKGLSPYQIVFGERAS
jgi:hypothetical protein